MEQLTLGARNILSVYYSATAQELADGLSWYDRANAIAQSFAGTYNLPVGTVAGIISALSPQNAWEQNVRDAETFLQVASAELSAAELSAAELSTIRTYRANVRKATRIFRNDNPEQEFSKPTSLKTRAFFRLILDPTNATDVCIDGHAASIWCGRRFATADAKKELGGALIGKRYEAIAEDYRTAARVLGILPHQIQAITWLVWRKLHVTPQMVGRPDYSVGR